jgi:hypothetical protein
VQSRLCRQFLTPIRPSGGGSAPGELRALKGSVAALSAPGALNVRTSAQSKREALRGPLTAVPPLPDPKALPTAA